MRHRSDMTFPAAEYERRLSELRRRMVERGLDAVIITDPENLMYLTDHQTTGYSFFQALIVPLEAEPLMITRALEESNVIARTWLENSRGYPDTGDAILELVSTLRDLRLGDARVGYERNSYYFPAYQQDRFHDAFGEGLVDCFGIVEEGRIRKSQAEIEVMQLAAYAGEAGMAAGLQTAMSGATENEVAAAITAAMFRAGGEFPAVLPYVASGPRSMIGHSTWEGRMIRPGEHVFLEVGGCYRRYHTAMMRTVVNGALSESMYAAQELMKETLAELRALMKPGVTVSEVDRLARTMIESNDVGAKLVTRAGYSIGIAFPPSWDEGYILSLLEGDERPLEEGMTFHLIPWMWGVEGTRTVGISDTVRITEDGCASFFTLPEDFTVHESAARVLPPAHYAPRP
ncbi:ectoine hydrolase [Brachybacterium saurashtrense]|uniref:Aminopeptidase P family protein n=1 Tax=Brachybacterium saurashtrense TaxID=556288 RepID=A0A345YMC3_9MICO|nr:ectoine hydrolase [Brachybacterium saurashtrense]AXK45075.1 aminopeptidase P family protein [Brachybacterium saurashtrense]RRR21759.1 aminopeptidase P family protein [Brachybacterium saurashtrense]